VNKNHIWRVISGKMFQDYVISTRERTEIEAEFRGEIPEGCTQIVTNIGELFLLGGRAYYEIVKTTL